MNDDSINYAQLKIMHNYFAFLGLLILLICSGEILSQTPPMAMPAVRVPPEYPGASYPPNYPGRYYPPNSMPPRGMTFPATSSTERGADPSWTQHLIKKEDRNFDFKTVAKGASAEHQFIIRNKFEQSVHIASVSSSCTCTTPSILDGKNELQTYEETAIVARYNTDFFEGPKSATITVVIDKPYYAEIQLNVHGDIRSDLTISPNSARLENVKEGTETSRTLNIIYMGNRPNWNIVDFISPNEHIKAEVLETVARPGQIVSKVKITLDDLAPRGELNERIVLISNDTEGRREIPILVTGTVGTVVKVTPQTVFLGYLQPGEISPVKKVVVRGSKPFRITKLLCNNSAIEIDYTTSPDAPPRHVYVLPIRYTNPQEGPASPKEGKLNAAVRIETDIPDTKIAFNVTMQLSILAQSSLISENSVEKSTSKKNEENEMKKIEKKENRNENEGPDL
ncbi:MAG: DUF1573 domain-containing protein [Thermoguttaceae bacterium]